MADVYDTIVKQLQVQKSTRIFDIGCGTGTLGLRMMQSGMCWQYKGLDRNPQAIEILLQHGLQGQEGDLRWYDGMKFYWDTVVFNDILEGSNAFSLMEKAILLARRVFILATRATLYDSLFTPVGNPCYNVDDVLTLARQCSFQLAHYEQVDVHSVLVFTRKFKGRKN